MFAEAGAEIHWMWAVAGLFTIPILILLNGLFVAAEFALVSVRRTRVEELVARGVKGAPAVLKTIENLDPSIAATQLGITLTSIGLGFIVEPSLASLLQRLFVLFTGVHYTVTAHSVAAVLAFMFITFLHVVFGELIPKSVALQVPDRTALWLARPLLWFETVTRPAIILMNGTGNSLLHLCGFRGATGEAMVHSVEELILLIEDTEEAGILDEDQAEFVQNVFQLTNKCVRDCMVPRDKMAALEVHMQPEQVLEAVRNGAHTRMPVYDGNLDEIVGIVNTKDLFYLFSLQGIVVLQDALYPAVYLKPDENLDNALRLFRKAKRPMAMVRDDDGVICGIITLEDILEEIVGDIEDEHDRPLPRVLRKRRALRKTDKHPVLRPQGDAK